MELHKADPPVPVHVAIYQIAIIGMKGAAYGVGLALNEPTGAWRADQDAIDRLKVGGPILDLRGLWGQKAAMAYVRTGPRLSLGPIGKGLAGIDEYVAGWVARGALLTTRERATSWPP